MANEEPKTTVKSAEPAKAPTDVEPRLPTPEEKALAAATTEAESKPKRSLRELLKQKKVLIPLIGVALLLIAAAVVWFTSLRYTALNLVSETHYEVAVVDAKTKLPVRSAHVTLGSQTIDTNEEGKAKFEGADYGRNPFKIEKTAYEVFEGELILDLGEHGNSFEVTPTGTPILVKVTDFVSDQPITGAEVEFGEASAVSDASGVARLVVPPSDNTEIKLIATKTGFLNREFLVKNEANSEAFATTLVPEGKIYFLSKRTGKIDVMKSNMDGSVPEVVLAGTGAEDEGGTVLLASRDWKFLALKARRTGSEPSLYLIDTSSDSMTTMDEGDARFDPIGWHNHHFVYSVNRTVEAWQPRGTSLKSFNAESKQIITLDDSAGEGTDNSDYRYEILGNYYIIENQIVYTKTWQAYFYNQGVLADKQDTIVSIAPDGQNKKVLKSVDALATNYVIAKVYKPQEIYFLVSTNENGDFYFELEGSEFEEIPEVDEAETAENFNKSYPTFLLSPSGNATFWSESRDGKNTLFLGDKNGGAGKELARLTELTAYGWYGENYLLVSKNGSELYVISVNGLTEGQEPRKVTDYHKPALDFSGYGYGYGGF